jgi:hypothetical protein
LDVKPVRPEWIPCSLIAGVSTWSWPAACLIAAMVIMLGGLRLLTELRWRRTLLTLAENAQAETIVAMTESAWLPAAWVQVGPPPCRRFGDGHAASHP